jgi:hypothetical protein
MIDEPGTPLLRLRPLPLTEKRAVGGPIPAGLLGSFVAASLAMWCAAAVALVAAADELAHGVPSAPEVLLTVHLVAAGALPLGVVGASLHLLPVMLRNDLPSVRALWAAVPLLLGGAAVAVGIQHWSRLLVWAGAIGVACGLAIVLWELGALVVRAPRERMLIASRTGVALALVHATAALVAGALIFDLHRPFWGIAYDRWLLVHLHLALVGWIALLIVTVGRNLAPMLALAPTAPRRRRPVDEMLLVAALWVLLVGLATNDPTVMLIGGGAAAAAMARFGLLVARVVRSKRAPLDAPLGHLVAGGAFLAQAVVLGLLSAAGVGGVRVVEAYVVFLMIGWAGGVVVGHLPKLLSLSLWVWWPPGLRPKQAQLYPRRIAVAETAVFTAGVEVLAVAVLAGNVAAARVGAVLVLASAVVAAATAAEVWRRRPREERR